MVKKRLILELIYDGMFYDGMPHELLQTDDYFIILGNTLVDPFFPFGDSGDHQ